MSTFNPSISDSPQDQMYSVLHVFYRLVLKTLNESRKLWVKNFLLEKRKLREFPGGLVVRTQHSDSQGWVWSLVRELKSHKLDRVAKKKKKNWAERKEGRLFYASCSRTLLRSMQVWSLATLSFILGDWIGTSLELGRCICVYQFSVFIDSLWRKAESSLLGAASLFSKSWHFFSILKYPLPSSHCWF